MSRATDVFDLTTTELRRDWSLIEASAGTGKTFSIAGLVVRMVGEGFVDDVREVLVVTFTIDATEELKTRVRSALAQALDVFDEPERFADDDSVAHVLAMHEAHGDVARERLARALRSYDHVAIQTIHAFCHRVLRDAAFESGTAFDLAFSDDEDLLIARAVDDAWRHVFAEVDPWVTAFAKARKLEPEKLADPYNAWRRATDARFEPEVTLDAALEAWHEALTDVTEALEDDEGIAASLAGKTFKQKYRERYGTGDDIAAALRAAAPHVDPRWFALAQDLAMPAVKDAMMAPSKKSFAGHAVFDAFAALDVAADAIGHALQRRLFDETSARLTAIRAREHVVSFHDVLADLDAALTDDALGPRLVDTVRARVSVALIDEFQDTDALQYRIFRRLFADRTVMIIGDPKQAIYKFRGADVFAYLQAGRDVARRFTLDRNWRSHPGLVDGVQALFARSPRPFVFDAIGVGGVSAARDASATAIEGLDGPPLAITWVGERPRSFALSSDEIVVRHVVRRCTELLDGGATIDGRPLGPEHVAILVRKNAQAATIEAALHAVGVPAIVGRADDVLKVDGTDELLRVLVALARPGNARAMRAACATHLVGDDAAALAALLDDDDAWQTRADVFARAHARWLRSGLVAALDDAFDVWGTRPRLLELPDGERRLGNLAHAIEVLHDAARRRSLSPRGLVEWFRVERERSQPPESRQLRLEREGAAVRIVTMHASKGLEYDVVLCPYQPIARASQRDDAVVVHEDGGVVFDVGSPRHAARLRVHDVEELAEDLRLLYVALTRAKRRAEVVWDVNAREVARSPLAYLISEAPEGEGQGGDVPAAAAALDRLKAQHKASKSGVLAALRAFVDEHRELASLEELDVEEVARAAVATWSGARGDDVPLTPAVQRIAGEQLDPWTMMSFSSWVHGVADERPDHEDAVDAEPGAASTGADLGAVADLARGPDAGVALHAVFEHVDVARLDDDARLRDLVERQLARHDLLEPDRHGPRVDDPAATVAALVRRVATTELPGWGFRWADVDPARRRAEWSFVLPTGTLEPRRLAEVFAHHGLDAVAARMGTLTPEQLRGYLVGFVDDVVEYDGRFCIVDWKSNHLGDAAADYAPERLGDVVASHHYDLQLMLYVVALQRFLRARLGDAYRYDAHVGGAADVFLRGVGTGPSHGFWMTRPDAALVDDLERFLVGAAT